MRSWMALDLAPAIWEAKKRLAKEMNSIAEWVQALKNDRRDEMKNFLFSSNEVRTFVLG